VEDADQAIKCDPGFTRAFCRKANAILAQVLPQLEQEYQCMMLTEVKDTCKAGILTVNPLDKNAANLEKPLKELLVKVTK